MLFSKSSTRNIISTLAATSCLLAGVSTVSLAQSGPGLTLFSGVRDRADILNYRFDFGGRAGQFDRYRLRIPADKMELGAAQFVISYPDYYTGQFDTNNIEVRYGSGYSKVASISEIVWDQDGNLLQIYLEEPILARNAVEIRLSNVRNPRFGGTFYFQAQMLTPGDVPLPRYLGTWILSVNN